MEDLLNKLKIPDKEKLLEFLVVYSRFEYSLKRSKYLKSSSEKADANCEKYISEITCKFNADKTAELKEAVDFLLKFPAKQQIIKNEQLKFKEHPSTKDGSIALRVFHCIRITRNNLFHGGKYPYETPPEPARNDKLIRNSIIVLYEFVKLNTSVCSYFWDTEKD